MEEIGEMIGKGFGIWRQNLNLCIPFLLNFFVSILVLISFLAVIFIVAMPLMDVNSTSIQNSQNLQDVQAVQDLITQMEGALGSLGWQTILMVAFLFLGMIVILSLAEAFFMAGAIGMARQALEKGRADTGAMWSAGRRHFLNMFLYTILAGLITMVGLVFLLPGIGQISGAGSPSPRLLAYSSQDSLYSSSMLLSSPWRWPQHPMPWYWMGLAPYRPSGQA